MPPYTPPSFICLILYISSNSFFSVNKQKKSFCHYTKLQLNVTKDKSQKKELALFIGHVLPLPPPFCPFCSYQVWHLPFLLHYHLLWMLKQLPWFIFNSCIPLLECSHFVLSFFFLSLSLFVLFALLKLSFLCCSPDPSNKHKNKKRRIYSGGGNEGFSNSVKKLAIKFNIYGR